MGGPAKERAAVGAGRYVLPCVLRDAGCRGRVGRVGRRLKSAAARRRGATPAGSVVRPPAWRSLVWLVAVPLGVATVAVPAFGQSGTGRGEERTEPADRRVADGSFLYLRDCGVCHGERGQGTPRGQRLTDIGPAEVDYVLSSGRMPIDEPGAERRRREPKYSAAERRAIVDYLRPFIAREPDIPQVHPEKGDIGEGAELYLALCAACHQWAGEGGALLGDIESPPLGPVTPLEVAEAIHTGPLNMPVFVLSDEEVNSIAAYVEYLKDPEDRGGSHLWHFGPLPEGAIAWLFGLGVIVLLSRWIGTRE